MAAVRLIAGQLRLAASTLLHKQRKLPSLKPISRNAGSVNYRASAIKEPAPVHYLGEALSFVLWYWILYHCWFEYEHLVPSHEFPDPSQFTDAELGIPPDDED